MIKFVAADMDGTLLDSQKRLPVELFPTIEKLHQHQVKFAVASGRQYYNLLNLYESIKEKVTFIAENGAIVFDQGKNIFYDEMDAQDLADILDTLSAIPDAYPILCGLESAYLARDNGNPQFEEHADMYYARCERVADLRAVIKKDKICKIAIYTPRGSEENVYPHLSRFYEKLKVVVSADDWVDVMNKTVNKGHAIKMIQEKYQIGFDETMAFGDYLNDYEMMEVCYYSYVMANGHPALKAIANFEAPSNDDNGVIKVLDQYLAEMSGE